MQGILVVNKRQGITSHDCIYILRDLLEIKKIGHTGTLDPMATGVLPMTIGKATRVSSFIQNSEKEYIATIEFGIETDTEDITGNIIERSDKIPTEKEVLDILPKFTGRIEQIPPMYSAVRVDGRKLYKIAREGKVVERKARPVKILDIRIIEMDLPRVRMEVSCSKGTYIRTLCHDIGEQLGCGGCMESLIRTRVSAFQIKDAKTLEEIGALKQEGMLEEILVPIDEMFPLYPKITVKDDWKAFAKNGNPLDEKMLKDADSQEEDRQVRLYEESGKFIAIYQWKEKEKKYHIVKMFFNE